MRCLVGWLCFSQQQQAHLRIDAIGLASACVVDEELQQVSGFEASLLQTKPQAI